MSERKNKNKIRKTTRSKKPNVIKRRDIKSIVRLATPWLTISAIACFIIIVILAGFVPLLSPLLGATVPRDLGVTYSGADKGNARMKSQLQYGSLPHNTPPENSIVRRGSQSIDTSFSSAELTALLNDRPYRYWPLEDVQLLINNDNTVEMSGKLISNRLESFAKGEGLPQAMIKNLQHYLPVDSVFYIKGKIAASGNRISEFNISKIAIGRLRVPLFIAKSLLQKNSAAIEIDKSNSSKRLSTVINDKLNQMEGFEAKEAAFQNGQLHFNGLLNIEELTAR